MDETDARLKAKHIDIQFDPVQPPSNTQKLKLYNMSPMSQKIVLWAFAGSYILSLITNGITFANWIGLISTNSTAPAPKPI